VGDGVNGMVGGAMVGVGMNVGGIVGVNTGGSVTENDGTTGGSDGDGTSDVSVEASAVGDVGDRLRKLLGLAVGTSVPAVGTPSCWLGDALARAPVRRSHPQSATATSV